MPAVTPVTIPEVPTVALVLLLLHVPPPVLFANAVVEPTQTVKVPVVATGTGWTVTVVVA